MMRSLAFFAASASDLVKAQYLAEAKKGATSVVNEAVSVPAEEAGDWRSEDLEECAPEACNCDQEREEEAETCNGLDNDCDAAVDECPQMENCSPKNGDPPSSECRVEALAESYCHCHELAHVCQQYHGVQNTFFSNFLLYVYTSTKDDDAFRNPLDKLSCRERCDKEGGDYISPEDCVECVGHRRKQLRKWRNVFLEEKCPGGSDQVKRAQKCHVYREKTRQCHRRCKRIDQASPMLGRMLREENHNADQEGEHSMEASSDIDNNILEELENPADDGSSHDERRLGGDDRISLVGFGSFSISKRAARTGRNPQTGKEIQIAAKNVVRFKAGAELSKKVN